MKQHTYSTTNVQVGRGAWLSEFKAEIHAAVKEMLESQGGVHSGPVSLLMWVYMPPVITEPMYRVRRFNDDCSGKLYDRGPTIQSLYTALVGALGGTGVWRHVEQIADFDIIKRVVPEAESRIELVIQLHEKVRSATK